MSAQPSPTIIEFLSAWTKENKIIKRSRIPLEKKVVAAVLCASGYTSRDASKMLGGISHVAVHDAYKAVSGALPQLERKDRTVTIEENPVNLNPQQKAVIWMARDLDSAEILAVRCSTTGSQADGKKFIQTVLSSCNGRPLLRVGRGASFPNSLRNLDFYFKIDTTSTSSIRQRISNFFWGTWSNPSSQKEGGS